MWPALRPGDEAGFSGSAGWPREGQVVVARLPTAIVAHRVVSAAGEAITLKGDNCRAVDPPVALGAILGVVSHVRRGGRILSASEWDCGPTRLGALRLSLRRHTAQVLRALGRAP
jgi:hypothetical protein